MKFQQILKNLGKGRQALSLFGVVFIFLLIPITVFVVVKNRPVQTPAAEIIPSTPLIDKQEAVVLGERKLCSFVGSNQTAVGITGEDGGESVKVGNTTYFAFGDTNTTTGQLPNSVAATTDTDASDCFAMVSKNSAGKAVPMLPKLTSECTVWPIDLVNTNGSDIYFFYYSFSSSNCTQRLGFGLGKMDSATLNTTRINNFFWRPNDTETPDFDIYGGTFIKSGTDLYILWNGQNSSGQDLNMLSKVAPANIENKALYSYWDGSAFQANPANMVPIWNQGPVPTHGMTIRFNTFLNKWTAIYNTGYSSIMAVRTADNLTGPWSGETTIVNCLQHYQLGSSGGTAFPCYGGKEHQSFEKNGGQIIYTSHSNSVLYQPFLHEVIFGKSVNQWVDAKGLARYKIDGEQVANFTLEGAAFYASPNPLPGFSEILEWQNSSAEVVYSASSPGSDFVSQGIAFYAPIGPAYALAPIYQWNKGILHRYSNLDLSSYGYTKGQIAFYAKITNYRINDSKMFAQKGSFFQIGVKDSGNWVSGTSLKEANFGGLNAFGNYSIVTNTPFLVNRFFGSNLAANSSGNVSFSGNLPFVSVLNFGIFGANQTLDTSSDLFTYWVHNKGFFNNPPEIGHQLNPYSRAGNFKSFFLTSNPTGSYEGAVCKPDCSATLAWSGDVAFCSENLTLSPTGTTVCANLSSFKIGGLQSSKSYDVYYCSPNCDDALVKIVYTRTANSTGEIAVGAGAIKVGDINGDSLINSADLAILISTWGSTTDLRADINNDGVVSSGDLAQLISRWGT